MSKYICINKTGILIENGIYDIEYLEEKFNITYKGKLLFSYKSKELLEFRFKPLSDLREERINEILED